MVSSLPSCPLFDLSPCLTRVPDSKGFTTIPDNVTDEEPDTAEFVRLFAAVLRAVPILTSLFQDTELEDDDDGSTTVTNSTANLVEQTIPILAEELVYKLESVTAALMEEEDGSFPEPPAEELSLSKNSAMDSPSHGEPITGSIMDPVWVDQKTATGTSSEIIIEEDETSVGDELPSQDDSEQDDEPWIPDDEIPIIVISPPSEVDPEDYLQRLDWEDEQEEAEDILNSDFEDDLEPEDEGPEYDDDNDNDNDNDNFEYAGNYPAQPVIEIISQSPASPVEVTGGRSRSPYQSPIITGMVWADNDGDEGDDLGPLPFTEEIEERALETVTATSEDSGGTRFAHSFPSRRALMELFSVEEPVVEVAQELVEEPQPAPEVPREEVTEPVPTPPIPSMSRPQYPIRTQAPLNGEDRGEGSSRGGKKSELPRPKYYHCCKLCESNGRPESWKDWKFEKPKACIPTKTDLQEWQFVRPTDEDGKKPTMRIAIDNLDAKWFRMTEGIPSYNYLTEAMGFFSTKYFRCWRGRTIDGVEYSYIGYATVDFDSLEEAIRMFDELQGRRLRGHTWHWRLEFVDPNDDTHGGRKIIRTNLVSDSVKQALAAELEALTRRHGRSGHSSDSSTDTSVVARPPARVRPQLSVSGRSLFAGAMANVVQGRSTEEQPSRSSAGVPPRRPYRSRS